MHLFADRLTAPLRRSLEASICFVHLPKCGGTSVSRALTRLYPAPLGANAPVHALHHAASTRTARMMETPLDTVRDTILRYALNDPRHRFVTGHVRVTPDLLDRFADRYAFLTMLRHPVSRWISHYFYDRYRADRTHAPIDDDLPAFLETPRARRLGSTFVRQLGGTATDAYDDGYPDSLDADIEQACRTVDRFDCVGVLEHLPAFLNAFEDRFGRPLPMRHDNPNPIDRSDRRERLTPDVLDRIQAFCRPDLIVYRHTLSRLDLPEPTLPYLSRPDASDD